MQSFLGVQWIITRRDDLVPPGSGPYLFADPFLMLQQKTVTFDQWLRGVAYKTGEFTLRSGQKSNEYMDVKDAILHPQSMYLANMASACIQQPCDVIAGVELGGALLAQLVAHVRQVPTLVVRKEEKAYGSNEIHGVIGLANLPPCQHGDDRDVLNVWLVEDVITTGGAVVGAVERLCKFGRLRLSGIVAVVDREQGGIDRIERALRPDLKIPVLAVTTLSKVRAATV